MLASGWVYVCVCILRVINSVSTCLTAQSQFLMVRPTIGLVCAHTPFHQTLLWHANVHFGTGVLGSLCACRTVVFFLLLTPGPPLTGWQKHSNDCKDTFEKYVITPKSKRKRKSGRAWNAHSAVYRTSISSAAWRLVCSDLWTCSKSGEAVVKIVRGISRF